MTSIIRCILFSILMFSCKNDSSINKQEIYRYDKSQIDYAITINSENDSYELKFLLDVEEKKVIIYEYNILNKEYKKAEIEINEEQIKLFKNVIDEESKFDDFFYRIDKVNGYNISFRINFGGDDLISSYKDVIDFKNDISVDFFNLVVLLRKEKLVNSFFEKNK